MNNWCASFINNYIWWFLFQRRLLPANSFFGFNIWECVVHRFYIYLVMFHRGIKCVSHCISHIIWSETFRVHCLGILWKCWKVWSRWLLRYIKPSCIIGCSIPWSYILHFIWISTDHKCWVNLLIRKAYSFR